MLPKLTDVAPGRSSTRPNCTHGMLTSSSPALGAPADTAEPREVALGSFSSPIWSSLLKSSGCRSATSWKRGWSCKAVQGLSCCVCTAQPLQLGNAIPRGAL